MPTYIGSNAPPSSFRNGGSCSACNRADRLVDIGVFVDYEGWVLLCAPCLSDAALCIKGMDLQGAHEPLVALVPSAALEEAYPGIIPPDSFPAPEPMEEEPEYPFISPPVDPDAEEPEVPAPAAFGSFVRALEEEVRLWEQQADLYGLGKMQTSYPFISPPVDPDVEEAPEDQEEKPPSIRKTRKPVAKRPGAKKPRRKSTPALLGIGNEEPEDMPQAAAL